MKVKLWVCAHATIPDLKSEVWVGALVLQPDRWRTMLEKGKVREILVDARSDTDVQIVRKTQVSGESLMTSRTTL